MNRLVITIINIFLASQAIKNDIGPPCMSGRWLQLLGRRTKVKIEQPEARWPVLCQGLHLPDSSLPLDASYGPGTAPGTSPL